MDEMHSIIEWVNMSNRISSLEVENRVLFDAMVTLAREFKREVNTNWEPEDIVRYFINKAKETRSV